MLRYGDVLSVFLFVCAIQYLPLSVCSSGNPNVPCRLNRDFALCVSAPIKFPDKDLWCPYHPCGPSFWPAEKCGPTDKKATHRCKARRVTKKIYICISRRRHKGMDLPVGCRGAACRPGRVCPCVRSPGQRFSYMKKRRVSFLCKGTQGAQRRRI